MLRYAREKVVSLMRFDAPFLILGGGGRDAMKRAELGLLEALLGLVVNAGRGGMCRGELRILLLLFLALCFLFSRRMLFLAGRKLLRLCFSWAVVQVCQAVKVWPLHGPNPPKFHL